MTFDEILEQNRPDQDNYDNAVAMSQRFQKATESPDFVENPFLNLEDAAKASRNPVNRVYNENDLKNITSDVGTIAWDSFRKGVMDLQSVGDKAEMAIGNTLAGISGNTLGTEMRDRAADSLMKTMEESRFVDSNYGDAETWTSRFVGGGMSMGEMLAVGAATGGVGLGAYVGTLSLSDGALNDMVKYQEEHGNLDGYETDPKNLALDYGNAVFQVASELMLGTGRLVNGKFLSAGRTSSALAKEALDNFIQESSQGAVSDITEILKGNKDVDVLKENAWGYIKDGVVAGVLGGAIGGSAYKLNKNRALQNLDKINAVINPNATPAEIREKSEEVFEKTEEKMLKSFVPELMAQNEAINDKGAIRENVRTKIASMYEDADMSEQEKAQTIEATTSLELENMLYDSIERKIPLTANPLLQGEVNELGWFRNGIPEQRRQEIENLRKEYVNLRDELKAQNESAEKDYNKIDELETKLEVFRTELPNRLQDLIVADREQIRKMLAEQRESVADSQAKKRMISAIKRKAQSAIKAQEKADTKLAEQMARGAEKAQLQREKKETAQQTKEAKIRDLQEQREIAKAIKNVKVNIARKKAKESVVEPDYTEDTGYNSLKQQGYTDEQIAKMSAQQIEKAIAEQPTNVMLQEQFDIADENARLDDIYPEYTGETIEVDGKERTVYNSNGDRIAKSKEALTNFWRWFGDSKVVDSKGRPLVVYHGTNAEFDTFDKSKRGTNVGAEVYGIYTTDTKSVAKTYGGKILPLYLKANNPYIIDYQGSSYLGKVEQGKIAVIPQDNYTKMKEGNYNPKIFTSYVEATKFVENNPEYMISFDPYWNVAETAKWAEEEGYDGVIFKNIQDSLTGTTKSVSFTVFEPNQIKSVDNRGTYSSDTGNIYKQTQMQAKTTGGKDTYRGAYLPEYRFIAKTENMDASTLNHELAHDWGQEYFRWARSGKASESFLRSWGAVEKAIGITDNDTYFTYDASEKFARAYEGWLLQKKDWAKILKIDNDDDKKAVESMMEDYRKQLVDIYESLVESSKYFKETFGEVGELKPELVDFFERATRYDDIELREKRGEITAEQANQEKLNHLVETAVNGQVENMPVEQAQEADAIGQIQDLQETANDTERFETEGGNVKSLQRRLDRIALAQDLTQNDKDLGKYDSHRDMLAVAEQADEFVQNRRDDALAIINGEMAEQDGLYASDLYTALERVANSTGDFDLIQELRNSKIANEMAKELGQRIAGFRNYKGSGDVDVVSVLNSLDKQLKTEYNKNKSTADEYIGDLVAELKSVDNNAQLDAFFDEMECR